MELTEDRFLGGRIVARQPRVGFRSGTDAVMLAAAVPVRTGERVLELGCGVGVASLCLCARVRDCLITGVDFAPELIAIAEENARTNEMELHVRFELADALRLPRHLRRSFDHVLVNPPFHPSTGQTSPNAGRALSLSDLGSLDTWIKAAFARVVSGGTLTLILRADRSAEALAATPPYGITVFPLWPSVGASAKRTILQIRKNSKAPFQLAAGIVLHDDEGRYTVQADAVLRNVASLALANPPL